MKKHLKLTSLLLLAGVVLSSLTSCVPLVAGAAGGYILNEEGYKVQSPITRE